MLKVGLIGCGGMGGMHANCWLALNDRVKLVAIADKINDNAKKFADKCGARIYDDGDGLLENEELDIIDVCVPTYLHTKYAVAAMKKGCFVFMEKPVCLNEEEAQLLLETQRATGAKMQVGQVIRFWDEYSWLVDAVRKGTYGKVVSGVFQRLSMNPKWSWENWYNDYTKSGTMALDLHVHDVDFIRYLMEGEPDSVSSVATRGADGTVQQIFSRYFYGDTVFTAEGCWDFPDSHPFLMNYRVKLEKATLAYIDGKLTVYPADGEKFEPEIKKEFAAEDDGGLNVSDLGAYYNEIKYFIDEIINGSGKEIASLSEAIKSVRLVWKEIELSGGACKK